MLKFITYNITLIAYINFLCQMASSVSKYEIKKQEEKLMMMWKEKFLVLSQSFLFILKSLNVL